MKKSLIAFAALAAVGAASAQSSVTLYGTLDVGVTRATTQKFAAWGADGGAFHTPARFGLKGSEDIGGGVKGIFDLQSSGIGMGNGSLGAGALFGREAYVGLSGGFGTVKAGRDASVATYGTAAYDYNGISSSSASASVGVNPVTWYGSSRRSAQIMYVSPNMGGADFAVAYVPAANNANKAYTQARVNFSMGGLGVGLVGETKHAATDRTAYAVVAQYAIAGVSVDGGYVRSERAGVYNAGTTTKYGVAGTEHGGKGFFLGAKYGIGAVTVGGQFAKNSTSKDKAIELFANYALSKRTSLYLDGLKTSYNVGADNKKIGLGVQHNF